MEPAKFPSLILKNPIFPEKIATPSTRQLIKSNKPPFTPSPPLHSLPIS